MVHRVDLEVTQASVMEARSVVKGGVLLRWLEMLLYSELSGQVV